MRLNVFRQEEYFEKYEFSCRLMMAGSGVEPLTMKELLEFVELESLRELELGYTPSSGYPELREAISTLYPPASAANVLVTVGAIEALLIACNILLRRGDEVLCLWPSYQPLYELPRGAGASVRFLRLDKSARGPIDLDALAEEIGDATRLVLLNLPHNPTGRTAPAAAIRRLADRLLPQGVYVLVDEVFRELAPSPQESAWSGVPNLIVVGSLSKAYGLPGLRVGWLIADPFTVIEARRFRKYTSLNPGALDQQLCRLALERRSALLERTREILLPGRSAALGWFREHADWFDLAAPAAGAIAFPRCRFEVRTAEFCSRLVEETGVFIAPGSECYDTEGYLRLGYAHRRVNEGFDRLETWMNRWQPRFVSGNST